MNSQQHPVYRLTEEARDALWSLAVSSPDFYNNPKVDFDQALADQGIRDYLVETGVHAEGLPSLVPVSSGPRNIADRQALAFYHSLSGMTPSAATDGLMWTWMTHFWFHEYCLGRWRWPSKNRTNHIAYHWFIHNEASSLRQNNTASRTWWVAHTAVKAARDSGGAFTEQEALEHFATNPRHYHNMMDSNFSRNPIVTAEILRALMNEAKGVSGIGSDQIWKRLNLDGGILLLDAMPREEIRERIRRHVEEVMSIPKFVNDRTRLRNRVPFRVLSLGAGVQSSCLALMAERGDYGIPKPDLAIFADTGWEPPSVYEHLAWLKAQLTYEVVTVSNGNIKENVLAGIMPDGSQFLGMPAFVVQPDGSKGILHRQCTTHYKTNPINSYLREILQIPRGRRASLDLQVEMWLGISADEAMRQKPGQEEWITKRYPLIELGFSRAQLLNWFKENYPDRYLPTSSCIGCPYHSDAVWKQLKESDPKSFEEAVFVDMALRTVPATKGAIKGEAYLHRSRVPLSEVDFSQATSYDNLMIEECEGLCGI